jgi:hypothetical protein
MVIVQEVKSQVGRVSGNGGSREEPGGVMRFPRSNWVPEDGVEPLTGVAGDDGA